MKSVYSFLFVLFCSVAFAQNSIVSLNKNWQFSQADENKWYPASVPGCIHTDLFENELIPHPFIGDNEIRLQWISDKHWVYESEFSLDKKQLNTKNAEMVFEGLDTYAKVFLNGKEILVANNAFRTWRADVQKLLKRKNKLRIEFIPAAEIEAVKQKQIPYELPEGPRMFTRKAAFQYGWDWGPKYNIVGIWRDIYINFWDRAKLEDVYIKQNLLTKEKAELAAEIELKSGHSQILKAKVFVDNKLFSEAIVGAETGIKRLEIPIEIKNPKWWWTNGLGDAYLYDIRILITDLKDNSIDEKTIKKGLRTIELVTKKDEFGESFYFKLNGISVFMKGANYIPQNSFQNWVTKEDYEQLLDDVQKSNMNMLRIWGGGIYEEDYFYELCDEKGILVWQDFMFANGMYPGDEEFLENARQEAIDNIKRLRNHASLALWCGNNEISEGWHRWGWQDGRSEAEKTEIWENYQKLFNGILPEVVNAYSDLQYWESSPKYGRGDSRYIYEGDAHDWWIWHDGHPFEDLEEKTPRFMSEFGFQSFPSLEAIRFINNGKSTSISTEEFANHEKHLRGFEIIRTYMERDFPVPENEEDYVYMSQLVQAYGMGKGIEAQRRNMPYTMGSLYWQLNDCWPVASWSGIESFGYWKPLQYQVQKSFRDVLVSFEKEGEWVKVFVVNDRLEALSGELVLSVMDFDGKMLKEQKLNPKILPNSSSVATELDLKEFKERKDQIVISAEYDNQKFYYYLVKPKDLKLKPSHLEFKIRKSDSKTIILLESDTLEKDVQLIYDEKPIGYFSEILPGIKHEVIIETQDFNLEKLRKNVLNDFLTEK